MMDKTGEELIRNAKAFPRVYQKVRKPKNICLWPGWSGSQKAKSIWKKRFVEG